MAAAEATSEDEFSEESSDGNDYLDSAKNEADVCFPEDITPSFDWQKEPDEEVNPSDTVTIKEILQRSAAWKDDLGELDDTCRPQDPEQRKSQRFLRALSRFLWKFLSKAHYVSILNDFVESEFFVIDGDSLLIRCLCEQGTYLSFIYTVECFLSDFIQKGAKYVIVFFKDVEQMYFPCPDQLFLRTLLIQHLQHNTDIVLHTEFSNCLSPEWQTFLRESCPYFMIISDTGLTSLQTDYLNILLSHSLSKKINVVLASGDERDVLRVYAYHVQSMHAHREFFKENEKAFIQAWETMLKYLAKFEDPELSLFKHLKFNLRMIHDEVRQAMLLLKNEWPEGADIRQATCVLRCAVGLKMYKHMLANAEAKTAARERCTAKQEKTDALTLEEVADLCRMQCLSVAFLCNLPLSQRAQIRIIKSCWTGQVLPFTEMIERCNYFVLKYLSAPNNWKLDFTYLPDLQDKSLWKNLVYYYEREYCSGLKLELGKEIGNNYQYLWNTITRLTGLCDLGDALPVRKTSTLFLQWRHTTVKECTDVSTVGLIAMKSDIVEDFAGEILEDLAFLSRDDDAVLSLALMERKQFDELLHWHSGKPLSDDYDRTKCSFEGKSKDPEQRRQAQKLQSYYQLYGRSLEGNISQAIVNQEGMTKKLKKSPSSKAKKIAEENRKKSKVKQETKEEEQWCALEKLIEEDIKTNFPSGIKRLEKFLKTCKSDSVKFLAELAALRFCSEVWKEHCRTQGKKPKDLNIAVQMMRRIHMLWGKYQELLQKSHVKTLASCLQCLGFEKLASSLKIPITEFDNKKYAKYSVGIKAARFQLQYMGQYLFREERSDADPRVQHFIPDTWQRELLDVVDNNESAVIVAPTSSGKTYASYYCMEKILRQSNDGVVVYVSPTKALVNQVVGVIHNRFSKKLPDGLVVCGVFTRDYRHDTLNCQILVTVPQCFEILMLSPHRQAWVKKIKYVIFDEVHCLGGEIGAEVWEHLLVMIRCPFLALSATISNPKHLTEWLQSVKRYWQCTERTMGKNTISSMAATRGSTKKLQTQTIEKKSYRVRLVLYGERYNDLEKYVCSLKGNDVILDHYHPCAALTVNHIEKYGIPSEIAFSPRENIQLYDAMLKAWPKWPKAQELDPEEFISFKNKIIITKKDAREYEQELKRELADWIVVKQKDKVNCVLVSLKPNPVDSSEGEKLRRFSLFVEKLHEMDKLPAIFFMFDIHLVERTAMSVWENLRGKQRITKNPNTQKEIQSLRDKLSKMEKKCEKIETLDLKKLSHSKRESIILTLTERKALQKRLAKLTEIPPNCTYGNRRAVDEKTFRKIYFRLRFEKNHVLQKWMADRGIGYHHSSMTLKERQFVEMLFRMGYIWVVTATSTLALGINMPCKSVVFVEDSVYLDALNYRQMSGRAGRRGQDLLGNIFFYDIPLPKVEKLMKSNVPELKGQFPLSITLILRLMLLAATADDKADAKAKVLSVLNHSLLSFKQEKNQEMLKLYFMFSLQFLLKEGFLDQEGTPIGYAGLVTHLHYHAPSNFVLVDFLTKGLLHKLCQPIKKGSTVFSEDVMEKLVLVLAHLFGRRYLPACITNVRNTFCQSKVLLEDLPEDFAVAVKEYNSKIENDFGCFLLTAAKLADMQQEYQLPLSKLDFTGKDCDSSSDLATYLMKTTSSMTAISPFASLEGMVDQDLLSIHNVNKAFLRTIDVNANNAPVLWLEKYDHAGRKMPLDAYALDFYKHGSLKALTQDNGLNRGSAYNLVKDFSLVITAIQISLGELCENENDNVVLAFTQLAKSYKAKLNKV